MPVKPVLLVLMLAKMVFAFDHTYTSYGALLSAYIKSGGVEYDHLKAHPEVIFGIHAEFTTVDSVSFAAFSRHEQLAFLINNYNFHTIDLIVRNLPLKNGIRDIADPWDRKFITLLGEKVSLNHIEHQLLRKNYSEPRIHFALVCASKGCPELPGKPFTASNIENQLATAGKRFLSDSTKNRIDGRTLYLSQIFEWYGSDFNASNKGGYRDYVGKVLGISIEGYKIQFLPYDWNLNRAENRK